MEDPRQKVATIALKNNDDMKEGSKENPEGASFTTSAIGESVKVLQQLGIQDIEKGKLTCAVRTADGRRSFGRGRI